VYALKQQETFLTFIFFYTAEDILIKNKINCSDSNVNSIRSPKKLILINLAISSWIAVLNSLVPHHSSALNSASDSVSPEFALSNL
jgi:hypothetical protein